MTRCRCIIHGNITSKPLTRCAALRGPRRADRNDFAERVDRFDAADFVDRFDPADFADRFDPFDPADRFEPADFADRFDPADFADRFLVAITYPPQDSLTTAQPAHEPTGAQALRRSQPSQTTTF